MEQKQAALFPIREQYNVEDFEAFQNGLGTFNFGAGELVLNSISLASKRPVRVFKGSYSHNVLTEAHNINADKFTSEKINLMYVPGKKNTKKGQKKKKKKKKKS